MQAAGTTRGARASKQRSPNGHKRPHGGHAACDSATGGHTDPATTGLQLRVREKRGSASRAWLLRYRWRGERVRIVIGHHPPMSLVEARERVQELRKAMDDGIDPRRARPCRRETPVLLPLSADSIAPGDKHSVEFLVSEFIARYLRPTRKRPEYAEAILNRDVLPRRRGRDARTIDPGEVIELLDASPTSWPRPWPHSLSLLLVLSGRSAEI